MRQAIPVMRPLYVRRNELVNTKLEEADFWPRVFANAPAEIDEYIRPHDAQILGSSLKNLNIERIGINEKGEGEPRDMRFVFEFRSEENEWFEGNKLVKEFYWRKHLVKSPSGKPRVWEGLVSEPVRINWKKGMDATDGLLDATCDLFDAEKALLKKENKQKLTAEERMKLPEYEKLHLKTEQIEQEVENQGEGDDEEGESSPSGVSFFAWFGYRGRDVTAAESVVAAREEPKIWEKIKSGEQEEEGEGDQDEDGLEEAEIFPDGEGLTLSVSEDLWPNALKYFSKSHSLHHSSRKVKLMRVVQSYELGNELSFSDLGDIGDEEDDQEEDEEEVERPHKKART